MKKYILSLLVGTALLSSCLDVDIVDRIEKEDGFFKTEDYMLSLIIRRTGLSYFRPMKMLCFLQETLCLPLFPTIHIVRVLLRLSIFGENCTMVLKMLMK